jgi:hypothetical protein
VKRVRYAVGALGAIPVLGLTLAAPVAKAAVKPGPGHGKRVIPVNADKTPKIASFRCTSTSCTNFDNSMFVSDRFRSGGRFLSRQEAIIAGHVGGLEERVRYYSFSGKQIAHVYVHGHFASFSGALKTIFHSSPDLRGDSTLWIALVESKHLSKVVYAPLELAG